MLPKEQREGFNRFYDSARHNEILEPKTTLMIHLAASMAGQKAARRDRAEAFIRQREDTEIGNVSYATVREPATNNELLRPGGSVKDPAS